MSFSFLQLDLGKRLQYMVCIQRRSVAPLRTVSYGRNVVLSGGSGLKLVSCPGLWRHCPCLLSCGVASPCVLNYSVAPPYLLKGAEQTGDKAVWGGHPDKRILQVPLVEISSKIPQMLLLFTPYLSSEVLCLEVVTSCRSSCWWYKITWQHLWENGYMGKRLFWDFCLIWRTTKSWEV